MLTSLQQIKEVKNGNRNILKSEKWLKYLALTKENRVNMERIQSFEELNENQILNYVERTLGILDSIKTKDTVKSIVEEVLKWSEVAKGGMPSIRKHWQEENIVLFAHNEASAMIYAKEKGKSELIYTLIESHGLLGQYLRGEVEFRENKTLKRLLDRQKSNKEQLKEILYVLNTCIIKAVSPILWEKLETSINELINNVIEGNFQEVTLKERLRRLRQTSIKEGENFEKEYEKMMNPEIERRLTDLLEFRQLWFVEATLKEFSFEEFIKIFLLIYQNESFDLGYARHITFEPLMKHLYYEHNGTKKVNLFKKRIIEKHLRETQFETILGNQKIKETHVQRYVKYEHTVATFDFKFSKVGEKLIDFCVEAEKEDVMHEQAIVLLFDFFGLRRDQYDRFHNEEQYLKDMNASADDKRIILEYIEGKTVLDIGPGGGVMLDMVEESFPDKKVMGIDISSNVIETLNKKKQKEKKNWNVIQGDALNLKETFKPGSVDTIIYSSIIHELFSYIPFEGKKFNYHTIEVALKSAFDILPSGGRIIIRDGVMTDENVHRIIQFKNVNDMEFLKNYERDFKGREIKIKVLNNNTVVMPANDAMEFLYTYTWGEENYVHEINEQFGYFTPTTYREFIEKLFGNRAEIKVLKHYLQNGYTNNLKDKISFYDQDWNETALPDSTCLLVIEKK